MGRTASPAGKPRADKRNGFSISFRLRGWHRSIAIKPMGARATSSTKNQAAGNWTTLSTGGGALSIGRTSREMIFDDGTTSQTCVQQWRAVLSEGVMSVETRGVLPNRLNRNHPVKQGGANSRLSCPCDQMAEIVDAVGDRIDVRWMGHQREHTC